MCRWEFKFLKLAIMKKKRCKVQLPNTWSRTSCDLSTLCNKRLRARTSVEIGCLSILNFCNWPLSKIKKELKTYKIKHAKCNTHMELNNHTIKKNVNSTKRKDMNTVNQVCEVKEIQNIPGLPFPLTCMHLL